MFSNDRKSYDSITLAKPNRTHECVYVNTCIIYIYACDFVYKLGVMCKSYFVRMCARHNKLHSVSKVQSVFVFREKKHRTWERWIKC